MKTIETDREFQPLFDELRRQDARRAPAFSLLVKPRASQPVTIAWPWLVTSALAILVLGVRLERNLVSPPEVEGDSASWASLSTWTTPSDVLLRSANSTPAADSGEHTLTN
jgi:hypothetical protein